jgi:hypothetical protein
MQPLLIDHDERIFVFFAHEPNPSKVYRRFFEYFGRFLLSEQRAY